MVSVRIRIEPEQVDGWIAELHDAGTCGIVEGEGFLEAFFEDAGTARAFGEPREVEDIDWVRQTEEAWPPLLVGERFYLVRPWHTGAPPPGRLRLEITPGMQCGTGWHPCTRKCLEAMERVVRPGDRVLDVGGGSGILTIAARLLGAGLVVACDIDPDAARPALFFTGSVDAVRSDAFDVVVANINEDVLGPLRADLERVARVRILSGFRDDRGEWACIVA
jgi:ribosomal protein L11 methyltransferase